MKQTWLAGMAALALLAGCSGGPGFKKTSTGLEYKIISSGKGEVLKPGQIVKFNFQTSVRDSVIFSSYGYWPGYVLVDSASNRHDITDILNQVRVGDSVICLQNYDSLGKYSFQVPPYMKKGDKQKIVVKILNVFPDESSAVADRQAVMDDFMKKEVTVLEQYIKKNNIQAEKTANGVFVEIQQQGSGPQADSGKLVAIKYSGFTLDGKYFDSNTDSTRQVQKHDMRPFQFIAGEQGAIQGMLEGIRYFKQGGKGRLFIPSMLAYGPAGSPPVIGRFENLGFEVELLEVKDRPAAPAQPGMPGGQ